MVVCLVISLFPTNYVGLLLKSKRSKTTQTKEHSKQSNTNKIKSIYQQRHERGNITNILIQSVESSSVCERVCMCVTNTKIMEKD